MELSHGSRRPRCARSRRRCLRAHAGRDKKSRARSATKVNRARLLRAGLSRTSITEELQRHLFATQAAYHAAQARLDHDAIARSQQATPTKQQGHPGGWPCSTTRDNGLGLCVWPPLDWTVSLISPQNGGDGGNRTPVHRCDPAPSPGAVCDGVLLGSDLCHRHLGRRAQPQ